MKKVTDKNIIITGLEDSEKSQESIKKKLNANLVMLISAADIHYMYVYKMKSNQAKTRIRLRVAFMEDKTKKDGMKAKKRLKGQAV